ncbi:MAG: DNA-binding domain-containing protein [Panacagrimonas sp.]
MPAPEAAQPNFKTLQYAFAAHLRNPELNPLSGFEDRRLQIYRDLFYNNVEDFLKTAFPVLRKISDDAVWHARARDFYMRHQCSRPQFYQIAEEFLLYLENERGEHPDDPPFMRELTHYEWVELALDVAEDQLTPELADPNGDLIKGRPLVSPLAWTLSYAFPVHKISPDFQPETPTEQPTYLIVYRNRQDRVRFMEVNAITARLMQILDEDESATGEHALGQIASELGHPDVDALLGAGAQMLDDLRNRDILLGTKRASE